jgi:hypothetical protein
MCSIKDLGILKGVGCFEEETLVLPILRVWAGFKGLVHIADRPGMQPTLALERN